MFEKPVFFYILFSDKFEGLSLVVLVVKNSPTIAGNLRDVGQIVESGRSRGEGHGNSLQYSCLENPIDRGAWWAHRESDTTEVIWHSWTTKWKEKGKVLVAQLFLTLCNSMKCSQPGSSIHGILHFLLQNIFPTQDLFLGVLHCRWLLYHLSY